MVEKGKAFSFMNFEKFDYLRGLSKIEIEKFINEKSRGGLRAGGVGLVRVEETNQMYWAHVRCNELPDKVCLSHPTKNMTVMKTSSDTSFNKANAVYYRCHAYLGTMNQMNQPVTCGYNIYPEYPYDKLEEELTNEDVNVRPFVCGDEERMKAEEEYVASLPK